MVNSTVRSALYSTNNKPRKNTLQIFINTHFYSVLNCKKSQWFRNKTLSLIGKSYNRGNFQVQYHISMKIWCRKWVNGDYEQGRRHRPSQLWIFWSANQQGFDAECRHVWIQSIDVHRLEYKDAALDLNGRPVLVKSVVKPPIGGQLRC